jgi:Fic family protein
MNLREILETERAAKTKGGIYHKVQVELTYNSNHIEGSRLTYEQTRYIYETNTVCDGANVDDVVETANHFRCIDLSIRHADDPLTEAFLKELHFVLKNGTGDSREDWFAVGAYKRRPNEVGGKETTAPEAVPAQMAALLRRYNAAAEQSLDGLLDFHYRFESIHPFQDGNGRVGRLVLFKECLRNGIVPFIIDEETKLFYYQGLSRWPSERGYLTETCRAAQDKFQKYLDYFQIS